MKILKTTLFFLAFSCTLGAVAQPPSLSFYTGMINYHGDLNPHSFTFGQANAAAGIIVRKPITSWFTARAGFFSGKVDAADRYNRDYLQPRNLSFYSSIQELQAGFEISVGRPDSRIRPYAYAALGVFHFDPWAYDSAGVRTRLQPLSTEGQGLPGISRPQPYQLFQWCIPFGGGIRFAVTDDLRLGVEFSQRKTFTDHLDDVSSFFVDRDLLLRERGPKAVELAYRGDELPGGNSYPVHGEQRGTPSEMDWYYLLGVTVEMSFHSIADLFSGIGSNSTYRRCPRNVSEY
ncbi:MAG TPA: DUF6089 family protein [Chitinophagaceae bacterium]|nr:DUF6089 family protein [Chitinophagaceae bacterium]